VQPGGGLVFQASDRLIINMAARLPVSSVAMRVALAWVET
jgi:hypothetical protein